MRSARVHRRRLRMKVDRWFVLPVLVLGMLAPLSAQAQNDPTGDWLGAIQAGGQKLRVVFHITRDASGALTSTLDSPDQGAKGIPTGSTTIDGTKVTIEIPAIGGGYEGTLSADTNTIEGTWKQGGNSLPLVVERTTEKVEPPARPQEPNEPLPYRASDVTFPNPVAEIELAGTLTLPEGQGPFPGVVLVSGSGPQNRNEELLGHKPFLVLSDYLTRRGIAVLRYDDRGVALSKGDFATATTADFATDALAATQFLRAHPDVQASKVGIAGHSEGGLIAPIAAGQSTAVSFIVLMGGPGLVGEQILYLQGELIARAGGATDEMVARSRFAQEQIFTLIREAGDRDVASEVEALLRTQFASMTKEERELSGIAPGQEMEPLIRQQVTQVTAPWFRYFLTYDPVPALEKVKQPVLAITGGKDLQVPPQENMKAIAAAFERSGNKKVKIVVMDGLNHLFQESATGAPSEYSQIEETWSPEAMAEIAEWILETTK